MLLIGIAFANVITIDITGNQFEEITEYEIPTSQTELGGSDSWEVIDSIEINVFEDGGFALGVKGDAEYIEVFKDYLGSKEFVQALVNPFGITEVNQIQKSEILNGVLEVQGFGTLKTETWMSEKTINIEASEQTTKGFIHIKGDLGELPGDIEIEKPFDKEYTLKVKGEFSFTPEPSHKTGDYYMWTSAPDKIEVTEKEGEEGDFGIVWVGIGIVIIAIAGYFLYQNKDKLFGKKRKRK